MATTLPVSAAFTENNTGISCIGNGYYGNQTTATTILTIYENFAYLRVIADYIYIVSSSIITVLCVVGNLLTLMVMTRKSFRFRSVAVYMSAMATSDTLSMIMDDLNNWMEAVPKIMLLGMSNGFCKFHRFFFSVVYTYSAWIVTSVCIERFIVVCFPFKAKQICSYRNTVITVLVLPVPISAIYLYNLWAWYADGKDCLMESSWFEFQSYFGPWISGFAYSYLPVVIMIILNAAIIGKLMMARNLRSHMSTESNANEKKEIRITITIVVICIFYVIMTVPLSIYYTLAFKYGEFINTNPKYYMVRTIVIMVATSSYATNFFLYVVTSSAFRKQLRKLVCCCCLRYPQPAGSSRWVKSGWGGMHTGGGGKAAGDSTISIAISSISTTRMTDVMEDEGRSVAESEENASSPISENSRF